LKGTTQPKLHYFVQNSLDLSGYWTYSYLAVYSKLPEGMIAMSTWIATQSDVLHRVPPLAVSILVTDRFCHFGSFALECLVFLALWWGLDALYRRFVR